MKLSEKERYYAHVILASKSWGMNTSYVFGWKFMDAMSEGKTEKKAVEEEMGMLRAIFDHPIKAQQDIMNSVGAFPFGAGRYMKRYRKGMQNTVEEALDAGVNYSNILAVPAYAVGDIGHHLCQSSYDMYKDDFIFALLESVFEVVEKTLKKSIVNFGNLNQILSAATGSSAASVTYLLESEGFTSDMVINLMMQRFQNFVRKYPCRGVGIEFHNVDFMDVIYRGNKILHNDEGKVSGISVDMSPLVERGIVRDFKGCVYPNCAITRIFSALMRISDHFCLLNIEPVTMGLLTNIIASEPEKSMSPMRGCKKCAVSSVMPERCNYCERTRVV